MTAVDDHFSDLSKLSHSTLRHYASYMLQTLCECGDAALIKAFCTPSTNMQKAIFPPYSTEQLLLGNAHHFPGMTLTVSAQPHKQIMVQSGARVAAMPPPTKKKERVGAGFCLLGADRRDAVAQEAEQGPRGGGGGRGEGDVQHTSKLRMN